MSQENVEIVRAIYEAWNRGDWQLVRLRTRSEDDGRVREPSRSASTQARAGALKDLPSQDRQSWSLWFALA